METRKDGRRMISIAFFHAMQEERPYARAWAEQHHVRVDFFEPLLTDETLCLLQGYDGLSYKQRAAPSSSPDFYRRLRGLGIRQIAARSAGLDSIDLPSARLAGLRVTNVPSYSPPAVAELVLAHVMRLVRHIPQFDQRTARGDFQVTGLMSRELSELTIGIVGVGRIGGTVARIFHALGCTVLGNDIVEIPGLDSVVQFVPKEELFSHSDVVTLHTYLDDTTYHMIDERSLSSFRRGAYLINASRGPVVDTDALITALESGWLGGAALDVVEGETELFNRTFTDRIPDDRYAALQRMPQVVLTPHVGFFTDKAIKNMACQSLDDAYAIIRGETSPHEV